MAAINGGPIRSPHYWDVRRPKISGSEAQKTLVFDPQWLDIQNTIGGFAGAKMPSMYPWDSFSTMDKQWVEQYNHQC